jgi:hypothetical protein
MLGGNSGHAACSESSSGWLIYRRAKLGCAPNSWNNVISEKKSLDHLPGRKSLLFSTLSVRNGYQSLLPAHLTQTPEKVACQGRRYQPPACNSDDPRHPGLHREGSSVIEQVLAKSRSALTSYGKPHRAQHCVRLFRAGMCHRESNTVFLRCLIHGPRASWPLALHPLPMRLVTSLEVMVEEPSRDSASLNNISTALVTSDEKPPDTMARKRRPNTS